MAKWHRMRRGDFWLRGLGLGALGVSYGSISYLMQLHAADPVHWKPGLVAYVLTTVGFLCGSAGTALTLLGAHLFDEIQVSERWRMKPPTFRGMKVDVPADIWSVADAASAGQPTRIATLRTVRATLREERDPLPTRATASVAAFRRVEDRGGLVLAMMVPTLGQDH